MDQDALLNRISRFERTVATCFCIFPILFAGQCLSVSLASPVFADMFADFGARLPTLTVFTIRTSKFWALLALALPIISIYLARKGQPPVAVVFATLSGLMLFFIAQLLTFSLFLPIFELGAVVEGIE